MLFPLLFPTPLLFAVLLAAGFSFNVFACAFPTGAPTSFAPAAFPLLPFFLDPSSSTRGSLMSPDSIIAAAALLVPFPALVAPLPLDLAAFAGTAARSTDFELGFPLSGGALAANRADARLSCRHSNRWELTISVHVQMNESPNSVLTLSTAISCSN